MSTPFDPLLEKPELHIKDTWKRDLPAGLVVFLVALPLCLGIALASGASMASGLITGIIGGVVVAWLSGSELSVSGPAAGLAVLVAAGIEKLGGPAQFSNAVLLAGLLQLAMGALRLGFLGSFIPSSVIKGMLAGIGVIIILKQIPHAMGVDTALEADPSFLEKFKFLSPVTDAIEALLHPTLGMVIISGATFATLLLWDQKWIKSKKWSQWLPGPLAGVIIGLLTNSILKAFVPEHAAGNEHLVQIPLFTHFETIRSQLPFPTFEFSFETVKVALVIAVVASIETLLSLEATDKLDPYKRSSNKNKELFAQGIGNSLCGLVGGIPMTGVIVRSSANIYAGAQTRLSGFVHGVFLFFAVLLIPGFLNQIPLASLAAILVLVGYKLTNFSLIRSMVYAGWTQWLPFFMTLVAVVTIDLLSGVVIGLLAGFVVTLRTNFYSAITLVSDNKDYLITFSKDVSFIHKSKLQQLLSQIPEGATVVVDGGRAMFIDDDIQEILESFGTEAAYKKIQFKTKNCSNKRYSDIRNR